MVGVDKYIIICPKFWVNHYTNIYVLSFGHRSRSNMKTSVKTLASTHKPPQPTVSFSSVVCTLIPIEQFKMKDEIYSRTLCEIPDPEAVEWKF